MTHCSLGKYTTDSIWNSNNITFGSQIGDSPNPILYAFDAPWEVKQINQYLEENNSVDVNIISIINDTFRMMYELTAGTSIVIKD